MKRKLLSIAALAATLFMGVACSGDDPEIPADGTDTEQSGDDQSTTDPTTNPAEAIVGAYSGLLNVTMGNPGSAIVTDDPKEIKLVMPKGSEGGKINLTVENLSLTIGQGSIDLGTIVISDCAVSASGTEGSYSFERTDAQTLNLSVGECTATASGTVVGDEISTTLTIIWNNTPITVTFEGSLKAEE